MTKAMLLAGACAIAAVCPTLAAAQEAADAETQLEEGEAGTTLADASADNAIIVTAQKREQALSDVPVSVSVVGGESLENFAIGDLNALAPRLPNVSTFEGGHADLLSIRGINSGSNAGFEQAVATFVDGAYRGRSRSMRSNLFDVERVEVLRGPQSTFFGNNAIAGAFNITTRKADPGAAPTGNFTALYEPDHGEVDLQSGFSFPLGAAAGVRLALAYSVMDGWVKNDFTGENEPHSEDLIGRASVAWQASDAWRVDFRVDGGRLRTDGTYWGELTDCPPDPQFGIPARGACAAYLAARGPNADTTANYRGNKPPSYSDVDYVELVLGNEVELGDLTLSSTTTYFDHAFDHSIQLIPVDIKSPAGSDSWFEFYSGETFNQFSQDVRLQSSGDQSVRWTVGAYYLHSNLHTYVDVVPSFLPFGAFLPGYGPQVRFVGRVLDDRSDDVYSLYGVVNIDITDRLRLNLGGRYSIVEKEGHRSLQVGRLGTAQFDRSAFEPLPTAAQVPVAGLLGFQRGDFPNNNRTDKAFMPSAGVEFDITPDVMAYATYTKGSKAGGWSIGTSANEFESESVDAYEAGIKGDVFGGRGFFSLALFRSEYKDLQEAANNALPNGSFVIIVRNAAQAVSQGVELTLTARVHDYLRLNFDGAYLDSKYTDFDDAPCNTIQSFRTPVNCVQDITGRTRPLASKWSGAISADANLPLGDYELRFTPVVYYKSKYNFLATLDPLTVQEGFVNVDARLAFGPQSENWELALVGKNLTNTHNALFVNTLVSSPGSSTTQLSRPRTVAFQASVRF